MRNISVGLLISVLLHLSFFVFAVSIKEKKRNINSAHLRFAKVSAVKEKIFKKKLKEFLKKHENKEKQKQEKSIARRSGDNSKKELKNRKNNKKKKNKIKKYYHKKKKIKLKKKNKKIIKKKNKHSKNKVEKVALEKPVEVKKALVLKNVSLNGSFEVETGEDSNLFGDANTTLKEQKELEKKAKRFSSGSEVSVEEEKDTEVVIVPPKPKNSVKGKYPEEMKDFNRIVVVILKLLISKKGEVKRIKVLKAYNDYFKREAVKAVSSLKFEPAKKNGVKIPFEIVWKVTFVPEE